VSTNEQFSTVKFFAVDQREARRDRQEVGDELAILKADVIRRDRNRCGIHGVERELGPVRSDTETDHGNAGNAHDRARCRRDVLGMSGLHDNHVAAVGDALRHGIVEGRERLVERALVAV
jgi:hypothetical protein